MDYLTNFQKMLHNTKSDSELDDIVGGVLKISFQYIFILIIILILLYNFYITYFLNKATVQT
jgi:hypothetical protein